MAARHRRADVQAWGILLLLPAPHLGPARYGRDAPRRCSYGVRWILVSPLAPTGVVRAARSVPGSNP